MDKSIVIERRAFNMEWSHLRITSMFWFDTYCPKGPWNSCIDLKIPGPGAQWTNSHSDIRRQVEEYFADESIV